jgi:hypothetical protein
MNIDDFLHDKELAHGTFTDTATIAQTFKSLMRRGRNWEGLGHESKEALEQVATLIARILNGDASDPKHWNGAAGYLRLRSNSLTQHISVEDGMAKIARKFRPTIMPRVTQNDGEEGGVA